MRASITLSALVACLPFTQASYRVHGFIQQYTNLVSFDTTYLPSIYVEKNGAVVCDGHYTGEEENPWNEAFIPGGIPTNTSFSGPWSTYNCAAPEVQVDVFGVLGFVLVRDYETAFYVTPDALAWSQPATGQGIAGFPDLRVSVWSFDSGSIH